MIESLAAYCSKPLNNRVAALFSDKQLRSTSSTPSIARLVGDPTIAAWALRALGDDLIQARSIPIRKGSGRGSVPTFDISLPFARQFATFLKFSS